jgi:hypothetical protein
MEAGRRRKRGLHVPGRVRRGFTFAGIVADGGRQLLFVETNAGTTFLVKAMRI